jgi:hypothetical protein
MTGLGDVKRKISSPSPAIILNSLEIPNCIILIRKSYFVNTAYFIFIIFIINRPLLIYFDLMKFFLSDPDEDFPTLN